MKVSEIVNFHPNMLEATAPIDDLPRNGVGASGLEIRCRAVPVRLSRSMSCVCWRVVWGGAFSFLSLAVAERVYV